MRKTDILAVREWSWPTRIVFGVGAVERLPALCRELGLAAPLLVTDDGLRDAPMVTETLAGLEGSGLRARAALFAEVQGNPTAGNVAAGLDAFRAGRHDGVVALGGGSSIDAGKAIAFMAGQDRPIWEFEDGGDNWRRARTDRLAPVIAVPTTAGTGSEVGRASVITDEETKEKKIIFHPAMMPAAALCDPELTRSLPAHLTAATGFDAFVHAFEAFCAPGWHPMADGVALEGMRLVFDTLGRAVADGGDMVARGRMMAAATMGAVAFQKGLGGVHALAHAVGAVFATHHGLTNAVLLPYVMIANRAAIEGHGERIARALAVSEVGFDGLLSALLDLRRAVGIPSDLAAIGARIDAAEEIGRRAVRDPCAGGNPIDFDAGAYVDIYRRAVEGAL